MKDPVVLKKNSSSGFIRSQECGLVRAFSHKDKKKKKKKKKTRRETLQTVLRYEKVLFFPHFSLALSAASKRAVSDVFESFSRSL